MKSIVCQFTVWVPIIGTLDFSDMQIYRYCNCLSGTLLVLCNFFVGDSLLPFHSQSFENIQVVHKSVQVSKRKHYMCKTSAITCKTLGQHSKKAYKM